VLIERLPALVDLLRRLPDRAGQGVVAQRLEEVASQALRFYERGFPMLASLFAEPALLARHRQALAAVGAGPHQVNELLAAYRPRVPGPLARHPHMKSITDTLSESRPVRHGAGFHRLRSFADAEVASQLQFARWPSTINVAISSRNSGVYF
jgi:hypothetical protein